MKTIEDQIKESKETIKRQRKALKDADEFLKKVTENVENFWLLDNKHVSEIDFNK